MNSNNNINPKNNLYYHSLNGEINISHNLSNIDPDKYKFLSLLEQNKHNDLLKFCNFINNNINFTIARFHDGEFRNMTSSNESEHNCDGNFYFKQQGLDLIDAYIYFLKHNYSFLTRWETQIYKCQDELDQDFKSFFNKNNKYIYGNILTHKIITNNNIRDFDPNIIHFFNTIKHKNKIKIYISNENMIHALLNLLNISYGFVIPLTNSYLYKNIIIDKLSKLIIDNGSNSIILLFSGGMFSKILIHELSKKFPDNTYIDIGSTFDGLIKYSRDFNGTREYQQLLLKHYS